MRRGEDQNYKSLFARLRKWRNHYRKLKKTRQEAGEHLTCKDATATKKGYTIDKVCKVCGHTIKGEGIPATSSEKPTNPTKSDGNTDITSPQTGDNSNLALWFAILFISGGGVIGVTVYSKRRKLNKR